MLGFLKSAAEATKKKAVDWGLDRYAKTGLNMAGRTIEGAGHASSIWSSKAGLGLIGLTAGAAGIAGQAVNEIENTDIRDVETLKTMKKIEKTPMYTGAGAAIGSVAGGIMGRNKWAALAGGLAGAGIGAAGGMLSGEAKSGALGIAGGIGMLAGAGALMTGAGIASARILNPHLSNSATMFPKASKMAFGVGAAALALGGAIALPASEDADIFNQRSTFNYALRTKQADRTQDFSGPEMAGAMQGRVDGPMSFGKGTPRNYSLGATGDLALALHHKRHG